MSFARSIKMLILSATFMGRAVITPILTDTTHAHAAGPHVRVYDGGYVAMSDSDDHEDDKVVSEEGDTPEEESQSSDQPEYKYVSIRRY